MDLLQNCVSDFRLQYCWLYADDSFVFFTLLEHLEVFQNFLSGRHASMSFRSNSENQNRMSFLDIKIICENIKFATFISCKPTFRGVYAHFESFLQSTYKFGTVYKLNYRCFWMCSITIELLFFNKFF